MKKLLLASTALVMSAGFASAQVSLSGDARMGITYDSGLAANKAAFTSRARVTFTLSGETDTGLAFGGSFRADNAAGAAAGTAGSVYIEGEFGKLTMGDTNGAAQFRNGHLAGVGLTGLDDRNEFTYLGNPAGQRPIARYDYNMDGFGFSASVTNPGHASRTVAVGFSYTMDGLTVGLGAEQRNLTAGTNLVAADPVNFIAAIPAAAAVGKQTHLVASVAYTFEGITAKAMYGQLKTGAVTAAQNTPGTGVAIASNSQKQYGLSINAKIDEVGVTAFGKRGLNGLNNYGVGASYDLGGGASIMGGIAKTQGSSTVADFGLSFSF